MHFLPLVLAAASLSSAPGPARTPVLVELFTSEGCSSCPPADRLLAKLAAEQPVKDVLVVPMSLHVDYWNRYGWADPFSSSAYSERQAAYTQHFQNRSSYTPQMVVDGEAELLGSDEKGALAAIAKAAGDAANGAVVHVEPGERSGTLHVTVTGAAPAAGQKVDVLLAVTEDGLASSVTRGENAGMRLTHSAVTRELKVIGKTDASGRFDKTVRVPAAPGVRHATAFVQERASGHVRGVAPPIALN